MRYHLIVQVSLAQLKNQCKAQKGSAVSSISKRKPLLSGE
ncbi:hypothetical protein SAMN06265220_1011114 [Flavobacterium nitrogenifigens]|uniref:Uncharacterized protein n=1 Tax=Flavobacterium nitrogenifigens TaxID=1617283 RepID=A0A521BMX4_9FLAO|nr:hypothetical protein SAMN06265220_1011114 [Flavobacterium nitrogenifigens]